MKTFNDLYTTLLGVTRRPDKVAISKKAIVEATLKAHRTEFFEPDYKSVELTVESGPTDVSGYRIRSIHKIQQNNIILSEPSFPTSLPLPENYFYFIQPFFLFFFSVGSKCKVWYFEYPIVSETNYNSWIADEYEDMIISEAAMRVFMDVGKNDAINFHAKLVKDARDSLIREKLFKPL